MPTSSERIKLWEFELMLLERRVRVQSADEAFTRGVASCFDGEELVARVAEARGPVDLTVSVGRRAGGPQVEAREVGTEPPTTLAARAIRTPHDLCSVLNEWAVQTARRHHVFHAGAAARGEAALLLPGGSYSGKTTLTVGLLRRGFALLSDEVGAVSVEDGRLAAYPRKPSIRPDVFPVLGLEPGQGIGWELDPARFVSPRDLGGSRADGTAKLALVVLPCYQVGAGLELERLRPADAILALASCSCSLPQHKTEGLDWIIALARRVPCFRLIFGALDEALDAVDREFTLRTREGG